MKTERANDMDCGCLLKCSFGRYWILCFWFKRRVVFIWEIAWRCYSTASSITYPYNSLCLTHRSLTDRQWAAHWLNQ